MTIGVLHLRGDAYTDYAAGYSEEAFLKIASAAPVAKVVALLGEPLAKGTNDLAPETYWYTRCRGSAAIKTCDLRVVLISNNIVISTFAGFEGDHK